MPRIFYSLVVFSALATLPAIGQTTPEHTSAVKMVGGYQFLTPNCGLPPRIHVITMAHSDADTSLVVGTKILRGMVVAHVQLPPAIRSVYYGTELAKSELAYEAGRFAEVANLLTEAVGWEPANPFLLNAYARALYQANKTKPKSYVAYQALFRAQRAAYTPEASELVVDCWFIEAYWKYGTLCLDKGEWAPAVASIEQFLAGYDRINSPNPLLLEQALGYLTEAFYQLHKPELCRYYGRRTLQLYPANQYVGRYLAALPKPAAKTRR